MHWLMHLFLGLFLTLVVQKDLSDKATHIFCVLLQQLMPLIMINIFPSIHYDRYSYIIYQLLLRCVIAVRY